MSDQIGSASIALTLDASGVEAGENRMVASVTRAERSLSTLGRRGTEAVDGVATGAQRSADATDRATQRQARSIQRLTAELQSGGRATREFQEAIARARGGEQAVQALRPYLDELDRVRAAQNAAAQAALRSGNAFNNQSQSAAQLAANLRAVPAQLTDIVTSLQGGQAPLTVFLQQGGQLRDMFGSAGGAARALGGYIVSLISPLTVGAAAVATLAVAYNQGSKEADAFRLSIVTTGNATGTTTSQLAAMAKQGSLAAGTVGAQAESLAALVGTGKVGVDQLSKASTAAVLAQKYLGQAVEDTVKNFANLGKAPLQASLQLNESMNYLTEATYQQIKALEQQGRTADAAKVAQDAYSAASIKQSNAVKAGMGPLESAWNSVAEGAKKAWDRMLDIGREDTIDEKIKQAEDALKKANLARFSFAGGTAVEKQQAVVEAQIAVDRLKNMRRVQQLQAESAAAEKKRFGAARANEAKEEKYLTRREQQERAIARARQLVVDAAPRGQDAAVTEEQVQKRIAQIRASYADLNNQGIEAQIANVERLGKAQELAAQRARILLQGDQDAGLNKSADKQDAYLQKVAKLDEDDLARQKRVLQQKLALIAQEVVSEDGRAAQQEKLAELRGQIAAQDLEISNRQLKLSLDLRNADISRSRSAINELDAQLDARIADTTALKLQLEAQQDENEALGLSAQALNDLKTSRAEDVAGRLEQKAAIKDTILGMEGEAEQLRKQAKYVRDLNKAQIEGANKSKAIEANKSFWESVDKTAQQAFTAIFEGGKSVSDRLKGAFKAGILDMLYQLTVKKWIIQLSTSVEGASIGSQIGGALSGTSGSSGTGVLGTASSLFSAGKLIYQGFSTGITSSLGGSITSLGNLFGSQAVSAFGTGMGLTTAQASTAAAAYGGTGTAVGGGLSAGASAASAIPIIGWIIAGMSAANGFAKQGFTPNNGTISNPLAQAFTLPTNFVEKSLGAIGVGKTLSNILSGAAINTKLFGRADPRVESQGLQGTINASGITAKTFADIIEKGGLFRSSKRYTNTLDLNADTDATFDKQVMSIITAVKGFGTALGEQTTAIDGYTKDFKLTLTGNAEEDNKAIAALFGGVGDDLSKLLIPSIQKLSAEGETAADTLARVVNDYTIMNAALGAIGLGFGAVGAASLESREALIALTGGLDSFVSQAEFFSQNFLSEADRTAAVQKQLQTAFSDLGVKTVPKTRDGFAELVKGLDLTSDSGQKTYAGLMNLQQAFASVTPLIDKAAVAQQQRQQDIALMEALGNAEGALAETRKDVLASLLSDQARITQAQIYATQDAKKVYDSLVGVADSALSRLNASTKAEQDQINASYNTQAQAIKDAADVSVKSAKESLKAAQDQASAILTVFNALDSALGSTKIESEGAALARRQAAQATLGIALANPGNLSSNKGLTEALATITGQSNERLFGTFEEYARDQARTNNAIAALKNEAGAQVDNSALTVKRLGDNIDAIQTASDKQLQQLRTDTDAQLNKLDMQLATATQQLDALKGVNSAILMLADAQSLFAAAIENLTKNSTAQQNATVEDKIKELYTSLLGRAGTTVEVEYCPVGRAKSPTPGRVKIPHLLTA